MPRALNPNDANITALAKKLAPLVAAQVLAQLRQEPIPQATRPAMSIADVQHWTGLSRATVLRRIADGTLPSRKVGRLVRIPAEAVDRLLAGH